MERRYSCMHRLTVHTCIGLIQNSKSGAPGPIGQDHMARQWVSEDALSWHECLSIVTMNRLLDILISSTDKDSLYTNKAPLTHQWSKKCPLPDCPNAVLVKRSEKHELHSNIRLATYSTAWRRMVARTPTTVISRHLRQQKYSVTSHL